MLPSSNLIVSTPPMGWNSWNTFGNNINETVVRETANALISPGLKADGYDYIVIEIAGQSKTYVIAMVI